MMTGCILYFSFPTEPPHLIGYCAIIISVALWLVARANGLPVRLLTLLVTACVGFSYSQLQTDLSNKPLIDRPMTLSDGVADVLSVSAREKGGQALILQVQEGDPAYTSITVQIIHRIKGNRVMVGDRVQGPLRLEPLRGPVSPGGYDGRLRHYFGGLSAVGYTLGPLVTEPRAKGPAIGIEALRTQIGSGIQHALGGQSGAVANALITGDRSGISAPVRDALRDAGLAHLLAISGLHVGIVAAASFLFLETVTALIPGLAIRFRPMRIAVIGSFGVSLFYLCLANAPISAQRAFVMVTLALIARWIDRPILSMRSVAVAALCVLVIDPSVVMHAGFQMSFAAATILVLSYEKHGDARRRTDRERAGTGWLDLGARWILGSLSVTALTQLAIAPFALSHFQALSIVAFVANLIAVPVMALCVIPLLMLQVTIAPLFGYEALAWLTGPLIDLVLELALSLADWPNAVIRSQPPSPSALAIAAILGCCVLLLVPKLSFYRPTESPPFVTIMMANSAGVWRIGLMLAGLVPLMTLHEPQPFAFLSGSRPGVAYYGPEGHFSFGLRQRSFKMDHWRARWGIPPGTESAALNRDCDSTKCTITLPSGQTIVTVLIPEAWVGMCQTSDILVSPRQWIRENRANWSRCRAKFIASERIRYDGPVGLYHADPTVAPAPNSERGIQRQDYLRYEAVPSISRPTRPWHPGYRATTTALSDSAADQ